MNRLKEFKYNTKLWEVTRRNQKELYLLEKNGNNSYCIRGAIIAIEEISDNTFLFLANVPNSKYLLFSNLTLEYGVIRTNFTKEISSFDFISEDLILFDKNKYIAKVYSISQNKETIKDIHYIVSQPALDFPCFCWSYNVKLLPDIDSNLDYPKFLLVNYKLISFHCEEYIQILVDVKSWQPISPAYSTLRNEFVDFSKDKKLLEIFEEENHKLEKIDAEICKKYFGSKLKEPIDFFKEINS